MTRETVLFVNPGAGRGRAGRTAAPLAAHLQAAGATVLRIDGPDLPAAEAKLRAAVKRGVRCVVAVGGDGTVSHALQAIAGTDTPLAVVPAGTGNDFARALGLPGVRDLRTVARVIADGRTRSLDLGKAGERWFATVLCSGFVSRVLDRVERMSVPLGQMQYVAAVLGEMKDLTPVPYRIEIDGKRHDQEAVLVVAANTSYFGGGLKIAPDTDPADGLLDVIIVDACTRTELVKVLPKLFTGGHIGHPKVSVLRGRHIRLDAPRATTWADGERSGALPLTAECVPGALKMIVP